MVTDASPDAKCRGRRAAECSQQFPPSDGDCHTPLPREVRKGTIPRHEHAVLTALGLKTKARGDEIFLALLWQIFRRHGIPKSLFL